VRIWDLHLLRRGDRALLCQQRLQQQRLLHRRDLPEDGRQLRRRLGVRARELHRLRRRQSTLLRQ
jgi:hypothetical protein